MGYDVQTLYMRGYAGAGMFVSSSVTTSNPTPLPCNPVYMYCLASRPPNLPPLRPPYRFSHFLSSPALLLPPFPSPSPSPSTSPLDCSSSSTRTLPRPWTLLNSTAPSPHSPRAPWRTNCGSRSTRWTSTATGGWTGMKSPRSGDRVWREGESRASGSREGRCGEQRSVPRSGA